MLHHLAIKINWRDRGTQWLMAILMLSLFLNLYDVWWGLPFPAPPSWGSVRSNFWWAYDTTAPISPLAGARDLFAWGPWSQTDANYPLFHYILLAVIYVPYMGYLFLTGQAHPPEGPGYPYGFVDPTTSLAILTLLAHIVSALMGTGVVVLIYLIGKAQFGRRAGLIAAGIMAVCYTLVFYSHTSNLDVPYLFWLALGLYAYVRVIDTDRLRYYVLLGVSAALSMATKDQAYGVFLAALLPVLWFHYLHRRRQPHFSLRELLRSLVDRELPLALGSAVVTYTLANNLLFNFQRFALHVNRIVNTQPPDKILDNTTLTGHLQLFSQTVYFVQYSLGTPLFLLCLAAAAYVIVRHFRRAWTLAILAVGYYLIFIVASAFYVHARFVLPGVLILVLVASKGLADALASGSRARWITAGALAMALAYTLPYALSVDLTLLNDARFQATRWIEDNVPPGATIEVYNRPDALPYLSDAYHVRPVDRREQPLRIAANDSDYIIVSERDYRGSADQPEAQHLAALLQSDDPLRRLIQGELGYSLAAQFKYALHPWLDPDIVYAVNPRIIILKRNTVPASRPVAGQSR